MWQSYQWVQSCSHDGCIVDDLCGNHTSGAMVSAWSCDSHVKPCDSHISGYSMEPWRLHSLKQDTSYLLHPSHIKVNNPFNSYRVGNKFLNQTCVGEQHVESHSPPLGVLLLLFQGNTPSLQSHMGSFQHGFSAFPEPIVCVCVCVYKGHTWSRGITP